MNRNRNRSRAQQKAGVQVSNRPLHEVTADAIRALEKANQPPVLFVRSGELVKVRMDERNRPIIDSLKRDHDALKGHLSRITRFYRKTQTSSLTCSPPIETVRDILSLGTWSFPPLEAVVQVPIVSPGGTVRYSAGYDAETRLYYAPENSLRHLTVPSSPKEPEVSAALALILELLCDFPFDSSASRANAIALLLTPVLRPAIYGNVPCALISAPQQGTGKSKLANIASLISCGRDAAKMAEAQTEDEWRKRITSTLLEGRQFVLIDNMERRLDSSSLSMALTAETWCDRRLGASSNIEVPQRATWAVTGNNLQVGGDIQRRCYPINLDSKTTQPWTRTNFRHSNIERWVTEHRAELVVAALTLARSWYAAGQPPSPYQSVGSFEGWAEVIGGILGHAKVPDFLANLDAFYGSGDGDANEWRCFLEMIAAKESQSRFTVAELVARMETEPELKSALPDELVMVGPAAATLNNRIGKAFQKRAGRRYGPEGRRIERAGETHGAAQWKVVTDRLSPVVELPVAA